MTDTLTVGNITQLVQPAGRVSWFPPLERNEFTFVVQPDPRDAYIAEQTARFLQLERELGNANVRVAQLEAALREIRNYCGNPRIHGVDRAQQAFAIAAIALLPEPEASMSITAEELEA